MRAFDQRTTGDREADALLGLTALRAEAHTLDDAALDAAADRVAPPFPLKVQVQTYSRCNAACAMCPYPEITGEPGFVHQRMDEGLYRRLLAQLRGRGVERLSPFLMNEPLLDKRMADWVALAREALPDTTLNLFSNGAALTPDLARRLADAGLDDLCVSVHGFERTAYERVMGGLRFERVMANLEAVVPLFQAGQLGGMKLRVVAGDVPEITETLAAAPEWLRPHLLLKGFSNERAVSAVAEDLQSSTHQVEGQRPLCQRPFVKLYVMADGDCVICNCDWRRRETLGSLRAASVADLWQGARYRAVRRQHLRDAFPAGHVCGGCDYPWVVQEA